MRQAADASFSIPHLGTPLPFSCSLFADNYRWGGSSPVPASFSCSTTSFLWGTVPLSCLITCPWRASTFLCLHNSH